MRTPTLTPTQRLILTTAIQAHGGKLVWFHDNLKGGARQKVIGSLWQSGFIRENNDAWRVTAAGYEALGQTPPEVPTRDNSGASAVLLNESDVGNPTDEELDAAHAAQVEHGERVSAMEAGVDVQAEAETKAPAPTAVKPHRTREDSKQATVIRMLQRPEGATLDQLVEATQWQKHTVRGCLAGTLKKKLGLTITSEKVTGGERVYYAR